jgi:hypothetical protein
MFCGERDCVFCNNSLSSRCMCGDEDRITIFEMINCLFLKIVEFEGVLVISLELKNRIFGTL